MGVFLFYGGIVLALASCTVPDSRREDTGPACGDAVLDSGEICDDGNTLAGDGCSPDCASDESCGNAVTDGAELCDDGNSLGGDGCSADCASDETCGNGVVDVATGETCDEGDLIAGDGCSANCQSLEQCGDGIRDLATGEECDNGPVATAGCDPNCTLPACGDGTKNAPAGEECDDSDLTSGDGCDRFCKLEVCGNARREDNEQCDDGNAISTDACVQCTIARCGDQFVQAGVEACDDGNTITTDACIACKAATCGDTFIRTGVEQCEDGNTASGDGCASCLFESKSYIVPIGDLINQAADCSDGTNRYNWDNVSAGGCFNTPFGFRWVDSTPFTPTMVRIEINRGITCTFANHVRSTTLNGTASGDFTLQDNGAACVCGVVPELLHTFTLTASGLGAYVRNGTNTLLFSPSSACTGFSLDSTLGGYARITVFP